MDLKRAQTILGVAVDDDRRTIKRKYHRLMADYHPDAVGSDEPEHVRRAQEINEAYRILAAYNFDAGRGKTPAAWQGEKNEQAFCERNIYLYYSMEISDDALYYQTAQGKYMWDPEEEEFELFLISIRHAARDLLELTEHRCAGKYPGKDAEESLLINIDRYRFEYQTKLFDLLARQYIHPAQTLKKLCEPDIADGEAGKTDESGRTTYCFRAFLHAKAGDPSFEALAALKPGDMVYPISFCGNKVVVADKEKRKLGALSLQEDALYFCVIPLLQARLAQVKLVVRAVGRGLKYRSSLIKAEIDFYFRLESEAAGYQDKNLNRKIADTLAEYEARIWERG